LLARVRAGIRAAKLHDELSRKADGSQALNAQLAAVNSRLERLTVTDDLTGLFNRRHAMCRLEEAWALVDRYGRPLSIGMIDIDHFKQINDNYGHDAGDAVLRRIAGILREQTRGTDAVCRVGGDEFLIVFPAQTIEESAVCAERCRMETMKRTLNLGGKEIGVSISIGLATRTTSMTHYPDLLKAADEALYAAKRAGRRVVRIADPNESDKEEPSVTNDQATNPGTGPTRATATNSGETAAQPAVPPIDMGAVLKRCGGDATFAAAVTERFRVQAGNELAKIEQALAASDAAALCRAAHSLKSMAAYMSANAAVNLAREIEDLGHAARLTETNRALAQLRTEIERAVAWITQNNATGAAPATAVRRGN
jgi:diguanylate cyclase (GGDEF)-like protein